MSIYKSSIDGFSLTSTWQCSPRNDGTGLRWVISDGPHEASAAFTFPVAIPAGAIIARAWIGVSIDSSPKGGIAYFTMNGEDISSGEADIEIDIADKSYTAEFAYKPWGAVEQTLVTLSGQLLVGAPTLFVDYVDTTSGETGNPVGTGSGDDAGLRLPRLLDSNMREVDRLKCSSLSVELNAVPLSTATMRLPYGQPEVAVDSFVEIFTPYGSAGIFRASQTTTKKLYGGQSIHLRHGIVTLADDVVVEGNAIQAPVAQVFASLFAMQTTPRWIMGRCDIPEDIEIVLERSFQSLLSALTGLLDKLPDGYRVNFDQNVSPWQMQIIADSAEDMCEFRLTRNLESLQIDIDRDSQCTRIYAFGAGEGDERIRLSTLIDTPYLDADNVETAGVIAKSFTREDIYDALTLKDVAQRFLDKHKNPSATIRIDGVDLFTATGVNIDRLHLGQLCRVPLPALKTVIREKVMCIRWPDLVKNPGKVTAELAEKKRKLSDELAELMREATNSKLIGGAVKEDTTEYTNGNVTQSSSLMHSFNIAGYGNVLSVQAQFTPPGKCRLKVDSANEVPAAEAENGSVDILRYMKSDENGIPLIGEHYVDFFAIGTGTIAVNSKITVKTVEKR